MSAARGAEGRRLLATRVAALPAALRETAAEPLLDLGRASASEGWVVATGAGSSAAQARLLAEILAEDAGIAARFRPLDAFQGPSPPGSARDTLVVFSQGLSPGTRLALARAGDFRRTIVVTAARESAARAGDDRPGPGPCGARLPGGRESAAEAGDDRPSRDASPCTQGGTSLRPVVPVKSGVILRTLGAGASRSYSPTVMALDSGAVHAGVAGEPPGERARLLAEIRSREIPVVHFAGANEFGTLVRVIGPAAGSLAAYRLARAVAISRGVADRLPEVDIEAIVVAVERATTGELARQDPVLIDGPLALVAAGFSSDLLANLALKLVEGARIAPPPCWTVLETTHGLLQATPENMTLIAFVNAGAPGAARSLDLLERSLERSGRRLVRSLSPFPRGLAILEHEAALDSFLLRVLEAKQIDPSDWPGRGEESALYRHGSGLSVGSPAPAPAETDGGSLTSPEIASAITLGKTTLVIPLGACEQHGPHLPLAADAWIAEEIARRLCAAVGDAVAAPVAPLGCSPEHMEFAGTLSLEEATLGAVLRDILLSARRHGFRRAFLFSGHGGNVEPLARLLPALRSAADPLAVDVALDLTALTAKLHAAAAEGGISAAEAGHHAGEVETSMLLAFRPSAVRTAELAPGLSDSRADAQSIFYPSLRRSSETGVVGDPRRASAARGERYLEAWTAHLLERYRGG